MSNFTDTFFGMFKVFAKNPHALPSREKETIVENYYPVNESNSDLYQKRFQDAFQVTSKDQYQAVTALSAIYSQTSQNATRQYEEIRLVKDHYLIETVIEEIKGEALAPDVNTGRVLSISSKKQNIKKEIEYLDKKFQFDKLIKSITPNLLLYGEYTLKTDIKRKEKLKKPTPSMNEVKATDINTPRTYGLLGLHDVLEPGNIVSLANYLDVEKYLILREDNAHTSSLEIREFADFVKFSINPKKIDLIHDLKLNKSILKHKAIQQFQLPKYAQVGRSAIYHILPKLKELEILEALVPASKLNQILKGTLFGMQLPSGYDPEKAMEAAKKVEGILNSKVGKDPKTGELSIQNIMNSAGSLRVLPVFGDKGQMMKLDTKADEPSEMLQSSEEVRRIILSSIGIPYETIYGGDIQKTELLRKYARYTRMLKDIQSALIEGIRTIIKLHLINIGIPCQDSDIDIEFANKLVDISLLDKLEFMDTAVQMVSNIVRFVTENSDERSIIRDNVDVEALVVFLEEFLASVGLNGVFSKTPKKPPPESERGGMY